MKKLLAVLMVMAMVLGMSVVASADEATEATTVLKVNDIEEVKAGETVNFTVVATQQVFMNAGSWEITWDTAKFEFANVYDEEEGEYTGLWALVDYKGTTALNLANTAEGKIEMALASTESVIKKAGAKEGQTVINLVLKAKEDVKAGDVIATFKTAGFTEIDGTTKYMKDGVIEAKAIEKATTTETPATTESTAATDATKATDATQATDATKATDATTAAATTTTTVKAATTKADAIAMIKDLASAKAIAAKLTKADFANAADFDALQAAIKSGDLATIVAAIEKANDTAIIKAVNDVVVPATTAAATTATAKADKTGDSANVLALAIVAIAAFGTAIVVYRKKVNA